MASASAVMSVYVVTYVLLRCPTSPCAHSHRDNVTMVRAATTATDAPRNGLSPRRTPSAAAPWS
jgi:hypothetical protein